LSAFAASNGTPGAIDVTIGDMVLDTAGFTSEIPAGRLVLQRSSGVASVIDRAVIAIEFNLWLDAFRHGG